MFSLVTQIAFMYNDATVNIVYKGVDAFEMPVIVNTTTMLVRLATQALKGTK